MSADSTTVPLRPVPRRRPTSPAARSLRAARLCLAEAAESAVPASRYVAAHLAALRAAAAVLAARADPADRGRGRPRSVWAVLHEVEPALREWAAFFAAGASKRAAAEAGLPRAATADEAFELLRDAEIFVSLVEDTLGIHTQPTLPIAG
jgi:SAV_6107-like HEPN